VRVWQCGSVQHPVRQWVIVRCAAVRAAVCGSVRHCVAVRTAVCGSAHGSMRGSVRQRASMLLYGGSVRGSVELSGSAAVCGSAFSSEIVWQYTRQCCAAVPQCAVLCGCVTVWQCGSVRQCAAVRAAVCISARGMQCAVVCGSVWHCAQY
jgi:hypothetical protein